MGIKEASTPGSYSSEVRKQLLTTKHPPTSSLSVTQPNTSCTA
nr:MAG TPA: hypothetical protein [Bacteriophage sp.]